jgi:hypothetical protein
MMARGYHARLKFTGRDDLTGEDCEVTAKQNEGAIQQEAKIRAKNAMEVLVRAILEKVL